MSAGKTRLLFAATAVLEGIRERNRKWTWNYFAERRDDRNQYINLFEKKVLNILAKAVSSLLALQGPVLFFGRNRMTSMPWKGSCRMKTSDSIGLSRVPVCARIMFYAPGSRAKGKLRLRSKAGLVGFGARQRAQPRMRILP